MASAREQQKVLRRRLDHGVVLLDQAGERVLIGVPVHQVDRDAEPDALLLGGPGIRMTSSAIDVDPRSADFARSAEVEAEARSRRRPMNGWPPTTVACTLCQADDRRKYVIMGVHGSGKGTQAKMLAEDLDLVHFSVGDIFRWNVQNHTKMGAQVRRIMASGELVGDDLAESVVRDRLTQHDWNYGFIIDGFPRNRRQAEFFLESYDINGVIVLDLPDSEVRRRVLNRRLCGNCGMDYNLIANSPAVPGQCDMCGGELVTREDDTEEALAVRLPGVSPADRVRPRDFPAQGVRLRRGRAARARDRPAADQEVPRPATVQARKPGLRSCVRSRSSAARRTRRWPPRSARTWACRSVRCGSPGSRTTASRSSCSPTAGFGTCS